LCAHLGGERCANSVYPFLRVIYRTSVSRECLFTHGLPHRDTRNGSDAESGSAVCRRPRLGRYRRCVRTDDPAFISPLQPVAAAGWLRNAGAATGYSCTLARRFVLVGPRVALTDFAIQFEASEEATPGVTAFGECWRVRLPVVVAQAEQRSFVPLGLRNLICGLEICLIDGRP
jgi:hypothetical protein